MLSKGNASKPRSGGSPFPTPRTGCARLSIARILWIARARSAVYRYLPQRSKVLAGLVRAASQILISFRIHALFPSHPTIDATNVTRPRTGPITGAVHGDFRWRHRGHQPDAGFASRRASPGPRWIGHGRRHRGQRYPRGRGTGKLRD